MSIMEVLRYAFCSLFGDPNIYKQEGKLMENSILSRKKWGWGNGEGVGAADKQA